MSDRERKEIRALVRSGAEVVFFGGAGVSTDSGIPDFRGTRGLYAAPDPSGDSPEYLLSHNCLVYEPEKFFAYYRTHMLYPNAQPNVAHRSLAALEREGILSAVITQNIDGLHQRAGSRTVYELHGSTARNFCFRCGRKYSADAIARTEGVPRCACGGTIRPDVVLYGEGLDGEVFSRAAAAIRRAEVLLVGGTSLTVQPAASLVGTYRGGHLVLINFSETPYDGMAEYILRASVGEVLPALCAENPENCD